MARFRLEAAGPSRVTLPVRALKKLDGGDRITYTLAGLFIEKGKAQVALVSIPTTAEGVLGVMEAHPAAQEASWVVPSRAAAIALVFGPQGMNLGKLAELVMADRSLVPQLADYAEKSVRTEMLLETVRAWERNQAGQSLDSALKGFASRHGMAMPMLNRAASPEEQALVLMRTLNPALSGIDPLASDPGLRLQQSAAMAATVAGLFFGNPVGIASAGGALFLNLRSILFPGSKFRSALAQQMDRDAMLCAAREPAKSRTQLVYLWAWRIKEPPMPRLEGLPYRVNLGETSPVELRGTALERIRAVRSERASIEWEGTAARVALGEGVAKGDRIDVTIDVEDSGPLAMPGAIEVLGPRPRIARVRRSVPAGLPVAVDEAELPANGFASVALDVENGGSLATVHVECADAVLSLGRLSLRAGAESDGARLRQTGPGEMFLSFGPGAIGQPSCELRASVETADGRSDPAAIGRVVRLPLIDSFSLSAEMAGEGSYYGWLEGEELDAIEKTGWAADRRLAVNALPQPAAGSAKKQRLRVPMPWPPPAPKSTLYVWLRGEGRGRRTTATD